ncbi:MAG: hypothetical protein QOD63_3101, partial [Actinomycetota bacterium]|nr:hypothetical protein [Actinomycetota bacterium]
FGDQPSMDAFLIPGGFGTRQEVYNGRLHDFIRSLPGTTLLTPILAQLIRPLSVVELEAEGSSLPPGNFDFGDPGLA